MQCNNNQWVDNIYSTCLLLDGVIPDEVRGASQGEEEQTAEEHQSTVMCPQPGGAAGSHSLARAALELLHTVAALLLPTRC